MLSKEMLIKDVEKKYIPMLKGVNIPDFTKCIAQFSGLHISKVDDDVIKTYLLTWAKNKYRFYKMLGNKIKIDVAIQYDSQELNVEEKFNELRNEYPAYALWLDNFKYFDKNKISARYLPYSINRTISELFPHCSLEGSSVTHFFKKYLQASDELITGLGKIWENQTIEGTYTISIDPVEMMFASENPYNWTSCYRLEKDCCGSHADGCLAAVLDDSSLITYIWNREGKFSLYDNYDFKNVRYFRMRQWISIASTETAIHFNAIYPGKKYSNDFGKQLRVIVENLVNEKAVWIHNQDYHTYCSRGNPYGYNEFCYDNIYKIKDSEDIRWNTYNEQILCPCGCGCDLPGNDDAENEYGEMYEYNGEGFIAENFSIEEPEGEWCDYLDDYCDSEECGDCVYWNRCHPVCEIDGEYECEQADEAEDNNSFNPYNTNIVSCGGHCEGCAFYQEHHKDSEPETSSTVTVETGVTPLSINVSAEDLLTQSEYATITSYPDEEPQPYRD